MLELTEYRIHELIVEDVEKNSPDMLPHYVFFSEGREIPTGWYCQNADGIWQFVGLTRPKS